MTSSKLLSLVVIYAAIFNRLVVCTTCPSPDNIVTMEDVRNSVRSISYFHTEEATLNRLMIPGTPFVNKYIDFDDNNESGMMYMIAEHENTVIIAFRGSTGLEALLNSDGDFIALAGLTDFTFDDNKMNISKHLLESYNSLLPNLMAFLKEDDELAEKKYIFTGYSLGGSMASLIAMGMTKELSGDLWKNPKSSLITFGQTRVGDAAFSDIHDDKISTWRKFRFIYKKDPVVKIPLKSQGWLHHSRAIYLGSDKSAFQKKNKKKRSEITFNNGSTVIDVIESVDGEDEENFDDETSREPKYAQICDEKEDELCVTKVESLIANLDDHSLQHYVGHILNGYGEYLTRKGTKKWSLEEAILATCRGL